MLTISHSQNLKELEAKIELWVNGKEGFVEPVLVAASASSTENQGLTQQNNTYFCSLFFFFFFVCVCVCGYLGSFEVLVLLNFSFDPCLVAEK